MRTLWAILGPIITVTWQWAHVDGLPDAESFIVSVGHAPGVYDETFDVPGGAARGLVVTDKDPTKKAYAGIQAVADGVRSTMAVAQAGPLAPPAPKSVKLKRTR